MSTTSQFFGSGGADGVIRKAISLDGTLPAELTPNDGNEYMVSRVTAPLGGDLPYAAAMLNQRLKGVTTGFSIEAADFWLFESGKKSYGLRQKAAIRVPATSLAIDSAGDKLYAQQSTTEVAVYTLSTMAFIETITLDNAASYISYDAFNDRLIGRLTTTARAYDASGTTVSTLTVATGYGIAVDPVTGNLVSANNGTVSVYDGWSSSLLTSFSGATAGHRQIAVTGTGNLVLAPISTSIDVNRYDGLTSTQLESTPILGAYINDIEASGGTLYLLANNAIYAYGDDTFVPAGGVKLDVQATTANNACVAYDSLRDRYVVANIATDEFDVFDSAGAYIESHSYGPLTNIGFITYDPVRDLIATQDTGRNYYLYDADSYNQLLGPEGSGSIRDGLTYDPITDSYVGPNGGSNYLCYLDPETMQASFASTATASSFSGYAVHPTRRLLVLQSSTTGYIYDLDDLGTGFNQQSNAFISGSYGRLCQTKTGLAMFNQYSGCIMPLEVYAPDRAYIELVQVSN